MNDDDPLRNAPVRYQSVTGGGVFSPVLVARSIFSLNLGFSFSLGFEARTLLNWASCCIHGHYICYCFCCFSFCRQSQYY